jgi:hypothetical protein
LTDVSFVSISGLLLSATALTDLSLQIDTVFGPSPETSLLACFQGMPCLRSLRLHIIDDLEFPSWPSTPKDIVRLSKLTHFHYDGESVFLEPLVSGLSAPSLQDVDIDFFLWIQPPIVHLPRFINEIEELYHAIHMHVTYHENEFRFSLLTQSEYISRSEPHFKLRFSRGYRDSLAQMSCALSTKLAAVKELRVIIDGIDVQDHPYFISWRRFYERVPSVKALRTGGVNNFSVARTLLRDHGKPDDLAFLPALEEIDLGKQVGKTRKLLHRYKHQLAAFQPFVSARQQAGRPVKVFFSE